MKVPLFIGGKDTGCLGSMGKNKATIPMDFNANYQVVLLFLLCNNPTKPSGQQKSGLNNRKVIIRAKNQCANTIYKNLTNFPK